MFVSVHVCTHTHHSVYLGPMIIKSAIFNKYFWEIVWALHWMQKSWYLLFYPLISIITVSSSNSNWKITSFIRFIIPPWCSVASMWLLLLSCFLKTRVGTSYGEILTVGFWADSPNSSEPVIKWKVLVLHFCLVSSFRDRLMSQGTGFRKALVLWRGVCMA